MMRSLAILFAVTFAVPVSLAEPPAPPVQAEEAPRAEEPPKPEPYAAPRTNHPLKPAHAVDARWSKDAKNIEIQILEPGPDQVLKGDKVAVKVNVGGLPLAKEAPGHHLRVSVDGQPPRDWYAATDNPLELEELADGVHSIRVFAVTPWGEAIKVANAFAAVSFYVGTAKPQPDPIDFKAPTLSANHPTGVYKNMASHVVLIDFFLAGATLSDTGHKVRVLLDDQKPWLITHWAPVQLKGLKVGEHRISLTLLDGAGRIVPGPYNRFEHTFTIKR